MVLHAHVDPADPARKVGFVVGRAVGPAVTRNQVRRRLRHLMADRLDLLPSGARLVVRATPAAAGCSSARLREALDAALSKAYG
jgi:ribonuclease P protein component